MTNIRYLVLENFDYGCEMSIQTSEYKKYYLKINSQVGPTSTFTKINTSQEQQLKK